jgi:glycosyltransferase involved in cell wall biosynthesis
MDRTSRHFVTSGGICMKIGLDLRRINDTGIGRFARNLLRAMIASGTTHEFTAVLSSPADVDVLAIDSATLHYRFKPAPTYSLKELVSMWHIARSEALDLVHVPHQFYLPWFPSWATVVTVHDLAQIHFPTSRQARLLRRPFTWFLKAMCAEADAVTTVSHASRDRMIACLNIKPEDLYIVSNAVDDIFTQAPDRMQLEAYRDAMALPAKNMIYVGMLKAHKNLHTLIKAFHIYTQKYGARHINLVIVGKADSLQEQHIRELACDLHIGDLVRFTGYLSDEELRLMYHLADVLVHPSLYEGFGLTPLEAMACGTPVIASRIPPHQEVCGDAALLVGPRDVYAMAEAMAAVLQNEGLAAELRRRGFANVQRYTWHQAGQQTLQIYEVAYQRYWRQTGRV